MYKMRNELGWIVSKICPCVHSETIESEVKAVLGVLLRTTQ